jgi:arylsulfatase A
MSVNLPQLFKRRLYQRKASIGLLIVLMSGWLLSGFVEPPRKKMAASPPNIIFILADDLGYGDLSCFGNPRIQTPHLDQLAREGLLATHFYAGSAVCSPSRACMLTGRFPLRFDIRQHFSDQQEHLPAGVMTLPRLLKSAGYATTHIGKWHLGGLRPVDYEARTSATQSAGANPGPLQHGFDHALTNIEDPQTRPKLITERRLYRFGGQTMLRNDRPAPPQAGHWEELKIDEAISRLNQHARTGQRFYINLWLDAPHTPYEPAPEPFISRADKSGATGDQRLFRSMVEHLDAQVGRLLNHLKRLGLDQQTLVVFTSDNGPAYQGSPGPFRGGKSDLHEGGLRVPLLARWPGHIAPGTRSNEVGHMADLLPTFCAAAGVPVTGTVDGVNLIPHWTTGAALPSRTLLWQMDLYTHFQNQGPKPTPYATTVALRVPWKLLADSLRPTELFHLENDHRELYNQLGKQPAVEQALLQSIQEFLAQPRQRWPDQNRP